MVGERAQDVCGTATHHCKAVPCERELSTACVTPLHSPPCHRGRHCPGKGNALKAGVGEPVGTRHTVSGTSILPRGSSTPPLIGGVGYFFPLGFVCFGGFQLRFGNTVDLQKSCKEHTYNFHIPLRQFPLIFHDNGTFVKTKKFNVDATLFTEYLLLFLPVFPRMPLSVSGPKAWSHIAFSYPLSLVVFLDRESCL